MCLVVGIEGASNVGGDFAFEVLLGDVIPARFVGDETGNVAMGLCFFEELKLKNGKSSSSTRGEIGETEYLRRKKLRFIPKNQFEEQNIELKIVCGAQRKKAKRR